MVGIGRPSLLSQTCVFWWNAFGSCVKNNSALFDFIPANTSARHQCVPNKRFNTELCAMVEEEFRSINAVVLSAVCGDVELNCYTERCF